ncbi:MAG TPA: redoxin domain-containing protein [candidate division Zixibacteria bacterium]|nr:redoxin domain-containing protein [candidate division Zixibacteria bacterium]
MTFAFKKNPKKLQVGSKAPDFALPSHLGGRIRLSDFKGKKNVLLAFFPMAWTTICTNQIPSYEKELERFERNNAQVLAVSVDSIPCLQNWQKTLGGITYHLLSDSSPHGEVSRKYRVLTASDYSDRVLFLIDKQGIIRYIEQIGVKNLPDNRHVFDQLHQIQHS